MKQFLKKLHRSWYIVVVSLFFILFYPFLYYFSRKRGRFKTLNHFRRLYALCSSCFSGLVFNYKVEKKIDWTRTYIICANHASNLDIPVTTLLIQNNFAYMGKDDLLDNPITGLFFKTIDIPLNRESKISSFKAFKRAEEYLQHGISLMIFPEGKIADDYPPKLHPFKNGPFRLAINQSIPIIPVTIKDAWKKMWDDGTKYGSSPGICHICVHAPVETSGLSLADADALRDKIYTIIHADLEQYES